MGQSSRLNNVGMWAGVISIEVASLVWVCAPKKRFGSKPPTLEPQKRRHWHAASCSGFESQFAVSGS
ncbi:hypothetical protein BAUCODRAFT_34734 [Baudoinia panamericana UAMH 10762]|uniref:Uncharacterized protein n=1 Tax=Baudoinia panamericana (strain UAMH 10762) TaxID=717646 RepID=M2MWP5_BAUPA|nr:uncharacterized protein BAUCODRAFT_34734 [Baudoinia panamericana UAMH 10762]EMC95973.1 hypothetical protein BAUCODRAFT_34734 [Baudoinia panamericana UAMH 10762]